MDFGDDRLKQILDQLSEDDRAYVLGLIDVDPLLNLPNRKRLKENLKLMGSLYKRKKKNRQPAYGIGCLFIDVDNFKLYNDLFSHKEGDLVLLRVGECMQLTLRDYDQLSRYRWVDPSQNQAASDSGLHRYGGDEFVQLLPDTSAQNAVIIAERLRQCVRTTVNSWIQQTYPGRVYTPITVSIGVSHHEEDTANIDTLIDAADHSMYRAKKNGKDRVEVGDKLQTAEIAKILGRNLS